MSDPANISKLSQSLLRQNTCSAISLQYQGLASSVHIENCELRVMVWSPGLGLLERTSSRLEAVEADDNEYVIIDNLLKRNTLKEDKW